MVHRCSLWEKELWWCCLWKVIRVGECTTTVEPTYNVEQYIRYNDEQLWHCQLLYAFFGKINHLLQCFGATTSDITIQSVAVCTEYVSCCQIFVPTARAVSRDAPRISLPTLTKRSTALLARKQEEGGCCFLPNPQTKLTNYVSVSANT